MGKKGLDASGYDLSDTFQNEQIFGGTQRDPVLPVDKIKTREGKELWWRGISPMAMKDEEGKYIVSALISESVDTEDNDFGLNIPGSANDWSVTSVPAHDFRGLVEQDYVDAVYVPEKESLKVDERTDSSLNDGLGAFEMLSDSAREDVEASVTVWLEKDYRASDLGLGEYDVRETPAGYSRIDGNMTAEQILDLMDEEGVVSISDSYVRPQGI